MEITTEAFVGLLAAIVGAGAGWLFSLHGRMSRHEAGCEQRQKNLDERHATMSATLANIDRKIDQLMGQS